MIQINLPCQIGDALYTIINGNVIREVIVCFAIAAYNDEKIKCVDDEYCSSYTFRKGNFGSEVFLTKEEAEQYIRNTYNLIDAAEKCDNKPLWFCKPKTIQY